MNTLQRNLIQVLATLTVAASGAVAMAQEPTQFADVPSHRTRADVKAEIASPRIDEAGVSTIGEATVFTDAPGHADRASTRQAGRDAIHQHKLDIDHIGG
jgi:hypothetical protein